jgi:hypothetical protein
MAFMQYAINRLFFAFLMIYHYLLSLFLVLLYQQIEFEEVLRLNPVVNDPKKSEKSKKGARGLVEFRM